MSSENLDEEKLPVLPENSLRPMTEDDLPKIRAIEAESYPQPWTEVNFRAEFEKPYSQQWVLTDDETDEDVFAYIVIWHLENTIEILNITVSPHWRGCGFARKMLRQVMNFGRQRRAEKLILDVRKSNLGAVSLYQSSGFTIHQIRKAFYGDGSDAFHMVHDLTAENTDF